MRSEDISKHLRKQPFQPMQVFSSDGSTFKIPHPDLMIAGRTEVVIGIVRRGRNLAERFAYVDPLHIVRMEPLNGTPKNGRRSRRK